ncbi:MAG: glycosyltransferase family 2 protein [Acidobacteria bacterium]|nr:glycosyltransferase family 2 protein [Acidobacteriota bacterium]
MWIAVAVERAEHAAWLGRLDYGRAGVIPVFIVADTLSWEPPAPLAHVRVSSSGTAGSVPRPEFGPLLDVLAERQAGACMVVGDSTFTALLRVAADALGIGVITILENEDDLAAFGHRMKPRPDLFLLATSDPPWRVVHDPRYGSTLLPVGRPGTDGGDHGAHRRIVDALAHWCAGTLEPAQPVLSVIVPAYNEQDNIGPVCDRLLDALAGLPVEILIVDDMSRDDTFARAAACMWRSPRVRAFTKTPPRGMGNAIRFGLDRARARYIAVTMGDGSDEVSRLPEMLAKVRDEGFALAIGSRYRHRRNYEAVPRLYRFWSAVFRLATRMLIGVRLSDYTNAFRVFDRRIFDRYGPESGGFELSPEITFKAWAATRRVAEVDVRHLKRASGQSSFSFLRAGPGYGKILLKAFVQRMTGRWFVLDW